jgi:hypothetical protein
MQSNSQPRKQTKQKYVQPPTFSISNNMKQNNPNHCRSLIDLNTMDINSA